MTTLIALLIASLASVGAVLLTQEQLTAIQTEGLAKTAQVGQINRSGTLRAAVTQWQLSNGTEEIPTTAQLIAARLLDPAYID